MCPESKGSWQCEAIPSGQLKRDLWGLPGLPGVVVSIQGMLPAATAFGWLRQEPCFINWPGWRCKKFKLTGPHTFDTLEQGCSWWNMAKWSPYWRKVCCSRFKQFEIHIDAYWHSCSWRCFLVGCCPGALSFCCLVIPYDSSWPGG